MNTLPPNRMRDMVVVLVVTCVSCAPPDDGPPSAWTYEVPGTVQLSSASLPAGDTFSATLLVTVSPISNGDNVDDGVPQSIGWSDSCSVDASVQDQDASVPDACGYLYQALVSRAGTISSPALPSCALPPGVATADLAIHSSSLTVSPDSQALQLAVQTGGGGKTSITYVFTSSASIPPPPAPFSVPCENPCN